MRNGELQDKWLSDYRKSNRYLRSEKLEIEDAPMDILLRTLSNLEESIGDVNAKYKSMYEELDRMSEQSMKMAQEKHEVFKALRKLYSDEDVEEFLDRTRSTI